MKGIALPGDRSAWVRGWRILGPLYIAVWIATLSGFVAIGTITEDASFLALAALPLTLGFALSLGLRLSGATRRVLPLLIGAAGLGVAGVTRAGTSTGLLPGLSSSVMVAMLPAVGLAWFLVVFSFCLLEDDLLLFMLPPTLTILGLCGTENPNPEMIGYFILFVVASIFALSYHSYLRHVPLEQMDNRPEALRSVLHWQLASAAVVFALVAAITGVVSIPLKRAGRLGVHRFGMPGPSLFRALNEMRYNAMGREIRIGQGPPSLGPRTIFRVRSTEASYWRSRTYDYYTAGGWVDQSLIMPALLEPSRGRWQMAVAPARGTRRAEVTQSFTFVGSWPSDSLPAAAEPAVFLFNEFPGQLRATDTFAVVLPVPRLEAGMRYQVQSSVPRVSPELLRAAPAPDPSRGGLVGYLQAYLQIPNSSYAVEPEAQRVVAGLTNNYDKARAIESYLANNYVYNLNVRPVPRGEDVVTNFLFKTKEGYCDIFASAMVVMCRYAGVPARLATGFAEGSYDSAADEYVVREMDAHAWVEVYFPHYGWIPFDPTPAARDPLVNELRKGGLSLLLRRFTRLFTFPALVMLGLACACLSLVSQLIEPWRRTRRLLRGLSNDPRGQILGSYYTACERLRRRVPRRASQTPAEYCQAVSERLPDAPWLPHLEALTRSFVSARFGAGTVPEPEARAAREHLQALLAGLKKARKR